MKSGTPRLDLGHAPPSRANNPVAVAPSIDVLIAASSAGFAHVFAADGAEHLKQFQTAQSGSQMVTQESVASDGSDHLKAFRTAERGAVNFDLKSAETVADVRAEFGSQYQRY